MSLVNVPGSEKVSEAFKKKVIQIAAQLQTDPNFLMAIMSFETGGSFRPDQKNQAGSGATGLIQFMPKTAQRLGTSTEALAKMTAEAQLDFVAKYFAPFKGRMVTVEDAYMAVLFPKAVGKPNSFVLFIRNRLSYRMNKGLDLDGDGKITKAEAASKVAKLLKNTPEFVPAAPLEGITSPLHDKEALLTRGDSGPAVAELQAKLVRLGLLEKKAGSDGKFGPKTERAVMEFQQDHGLEPSGALTSETATSLESALATVASTNVTVVSTAVDTLLPASGTGYTHYLRGTNGRNQYGRATTIQAIQQLGIAWAAVHPEVPFQVGHISLKGGGHFPPHGSHRKGVDVDIRPFRKDHNLVAVTIHDAQYDHALTKAFVQLVRTRHPNIVIFFNDPKLVNKETRFVDGHDNHLHLRFPE
ncbi:MAG: penicillin-insensitive murein endopeptidase [Acidobacteria bacterium]|nr:penicillin-insensitive murein endopeptidase [Acidobacteriota bacterium]